jgi:hypothetical protein
MVDGFLGRWSQRKQAVRTGQPVQEPDRAATTTVPEARKPPAHPRVAVPGSDPAEGASDPATEPPAPTLQDVAALRADSDFKPFVARAVAPEVRNAAMKKLFADPHFNVMDGLDTYIDDYSLPDPLPVAMLRKMASAKFMQLFDDDATADDKRTADEGPAPRAVTDQNPPAQAAPQQTLAGNDPADPADPTVTADLADPADPADASGPPPDQPRSNVTDPRT